jgi:branched-chain amino acid transport system substrate-binding protein
MRRKWLAAVGAVALVATVGVVTAGGSVASTPTASFTGTPIKIGLTYVCNAAQPPSVCEMAPSAQAAAKYFNAKGGAKTADGKTHELSIVVCNNENDRTKTADCGRQFVDEKVTFATGGAVNADEIVPVLGAAGISYFNPTPLGTGAVEGQSTNSYLLGSTLSLFQGLVERLAKAGNKDIEVVAQGAGAAIAGLTKNIAKSNGAETTLVEVAQTNPNWAQAAEQASSGDVIMLVVDKYGAKAFLDAMTQAGKKTPVTSVIGIIGDQLVQATGGKDSPLFGQISTGYFPPVPDKAWADYRAAMKKYSPKTLQEPASQSMFMSVQLGNEVIKTIASDPTAANFVTAANAMTDIPTLGGKLPSGLSFQSPQGLYERQFNNTFWGDLKITATQVNNAKGASFLPVPAFG